MHNCMLDCIHYSKKASTPIDEGPIGDCISAVSKRSIARRRLLREPVIDNPANGCNTMSASLCKLLEGETLNDPLLEPSKVPTMFVTGDGPQERVLALMAVPSLTSTRGSAILFDPDRCTVRAVFFS